MTLLDSLLKSLADNFSHILMCIIISDFACIDGS